MQHPVKGLGYAAGLGLLFFSSATAASAVVPVAPSFYGGLARSAQLRALKIEFVCGRISLSRYIEALERFAESR